MLVMLVRCLLKTVLISSEKSVFVIHIIVFMFSVLQSINI